MSNYYKTEHIHGFVFPETLKFVEVAVLPPDPADRRYHIFGIVDTAFLQASQPYFWAGWRLQPGSLSIKYAESIGSRGICSKNRKPVDINQAPK